MPKDDEPDGDMLLPGIMRKYRENTKNFRFFSSKDESRYTRIDDNDPNPKLAALKRDFDKMLEHPLVKKFKRNKMSLYIGNDVGDTGFVISNGKSIIISAGLIDFMSAEELKAGVAHELGHQLRADNHPRNRPYKKERNRYDKEICADKISVLLTENSEALISAIKTVEHYNKCKTTEYIISKAGDDIIKRDELRIKITERQKVSGPYLSINARSSLIRATGARLKDPQSKRGLVAEIESELLDRHKTIFPGRFTRAIKNRMEQPLQK